MKQFFLLADRIVQATHRAQNRVVVGPTVALNEAREGRKVRERFALRTDLACAIAGIGNGFTTNHGLLQFALL
jgi:hypothetical protein